LDSDEQLDPKFVVRNAKSKLKAQKNKDKAQKQSSQVVRLSKHSELPHHASALSWSIVKFTKGMLGCYSPSSKLPIPPSTEELEGWENWSSNCQAAVHAAIEAQSEKSHAKNKAKRRMMIHNHSSDLKIVIQPINYNPAPSTKSKIPGIFQTACHDNFKSGGFPRITFDRTEPDLSNSDWNSATADILALNWNKWFIHNQASAKKLKQKVKATGVIQRWLVTMKRKYAKQMAEAEEVDEHWLENARLRRYRQQRQKLSH
jgi:hypothetical protein